MRNPFLIVRFVFLCLLAYLNLLTVVFSAWNIHATLSTKQTVETSVGIMITTSLLAIGFVLAILAELVSACIKVQIAVECGVAAFLAIFQIGTAIGLTASNHLSACQEPAFLAICSSTSILVPTVWFSSSTVFVYFIVLFVVTIAHGGASGNGDIWSRTALTVEWFRDMDSSSQLSGTTGKENDTWTRYIENLSSSGAPSASSKSLFTSGSSPCVDIEKAPWAPEIRRGVEHPFALPRLNNEAASVSSEPSSSFTAAAEQEVKSKFNEDFRDSSQLDITLTRDYELDHDKPIPLPRSSASWFPAHAIHSRF